MASLQSQGNTATLRSSVGSISYSGGTARFETSTTLLQSGIDASRATPASADGSMTVGIGILDKANVAQNVANVTIPATGAATLTPVAGQFEKLPQNLQGVIGAGGINLAKQSIQGAIGDVGLKDATPLAANAAQAATNAVQGAVGAVAAPSPGSAAAAAGGGGIRYPKDMDGSQDQIIFTCPEGSYPGPAVLGIQPQIGDSNAVEWGGSQLNAIQLAFANAAKTTLGGGVGKDSTFSEAFGKAGEELLNQFRKYYSNPTNQKLFQNYIIEQATGLQGLSAREDFGGAILNPNLELVFSAPTLRPFTFTFRMTPREKAESDNVRKIIRFFKENMAPRGRQGSVALKRPPYFEIKYSGKAASSGSLNLIKKCALTNCSVDYTPDGSYMSYQDDGAMTAYNLTLQFQEIEPVYDQDYKEVPADQIGY